MTRFYLNNLSKKYGSRDVLRDLSLTAAAGELILVTGANGSGKSTLVEILTGQTLADTGTLSSGDQQTYNLSRSHLFGAWQNIYTHAQNGIRSCAQSAPLFNSLPLSWNARLADPFATARLNLDTNNVGNVFRRNPQFSEKHAGSLKSPRTMSFGERRTFAIERQTAFMPRLCILDEPCAGLDAQNTESLKTQLRALRNSDTVTIVFEHLSNIPRLYEVFDAAYLLCDGQLSARPLSSFQTDAPLDSGRLASAFSFKPAPVGDNTLVDETPGYGLSVSASARADTKMEFMPPLFERVAQVPIRAKPHGVHYVRAPNGWGKTSLCSEIFGIKAGFNMAVRVELDGVDISHLSPSKRRELGLSFLRTEPAFPPDAKVGSLFRATGVSPDARSSTFLSRKIGTLSGGERRYVLLDLFLGQPNLKYCLLDEPFLGLDSENRRMALRKLAAAGETACLIVFEPE